MTKPEIEIFWPSSLPFDPAVGEEAILRQAGVNATCRLRPVRRGAADVVLVLVSTAVLEPFLRTLFQRLAEEAHAGLKAFVKRLLERPAEGAPTPEGVEIESGATGARLLFTVDLPEKAYEQAVDLEAGNERWIWNRRLAMWTPA